MNHMINTKLYLMVTLHLYSVCDTGITLAYGVVLHTVVTIKIRIKNDILS